MNKSKRIFIIGHSGAGKGVLAQAFLNTLRQERDALYEEVASFSLSSDDGAIEEHAASIVKAMEK